VLAGELRRLYHYKHANHALRLNLNVLILPSSSFKLGLCCQGIEWLIMTCRDLGLVIDTGREEGRRIVVLERVDQTCRDSTHLNR